MIDMGKLYETLITFGHGEQGEGLALFVEILEGGKGLAFHDTNRAHLFHGKVSEETDDGFTWTVERHKDVSMWTIRFQVMTLDRFNKEWRGKRVGEVPPFKYEEDLHEWYRRHF